MELFYRIYDETSRLSGQKADFEKRIRTLSEERKELLGQQDKIAKSMINCLSELNDQHAFNEQLNITNTGRERSIRMQKKKSNNIFKEVMTLTNQKVDALKLR